MSKRDTGKCPFCYAIIELDSYNDIGDEISCHDCGTQLEITKINPISLVISRKFEDIGENDDDWEE